MTAACLEGLNAGFPGEARVITTLIVERTGSDSQAAATVVGIGVKTSKFRYLRRVSSSSLDAKRFLGLGPVRLAAYSSNVGPP